MRQHCLAFVALLTTPRRTLATMTQPRFTITYVSLIFAKKRPKESSEGVVCDDCHDWQTTSRGLQSHCLFSSYLEPQLRRGPPGIPNCCRLRCKSVSWERNYTQPNQQVSDSCRGDGQYRLDQRERVVGKSKGLVSKVCIQTNQSDRANHCKLGGFKGRV
jgi:hypothetical protein